MKQEEHHYIRGNKQLRLNLYLIIAVYLLLAVLIEPIIDFFLVSDPTHADPIAVMAMGDKKRMIANYIYTIWRLPPALFFLWYGYRVIASLSMPPTGTRFPFTIRLVTGKMARVFGMLLIMVSLLLLYRELVMLLQIVR